MKLFYLLRQTHLRVCHRAGLTETVRLIDFELELAVHDTDQLFGQGCSTTSHLSLAAKNQLIISDRIVEAKLRTIRREFKSNC